MARPLPRALTTAERLVDAPVATTFAVLTDLRQHEGAFPLTRITTPPPPARVGDRSVAVTAGVLRDEMVLERLARSDDDSGGGARLVVYRKVGGFFRGTATLTARPVGADRTAVTWVYDVALAHTPAALTRLVATVACTVVARAALRHLAGIAENRATSRPVERDR